MSRRTALALAALGAALLSLAFPADLFTFWRALKILAHGGDALAVSDEYFPVNLWPLCFVALIPWTLMVEGSARVWRRMFVAAVVFFAWSTGWLAEVTAGGYLFGNFMAAWLLVIWAAALKRLRARTGWSYTVLLPLSWTSLELLREHWPISYPWHLIGYPLVSWSTVSQAADLFGVYGLGFAVALVNGFLVDTLLGWIKNRESGVGSRDRVGDPPGEPVQATRPEAQRELRPPRLKPQASSLKPQASSPRLRTAVILVWAGLVLYGWWRRDDVRESTIEGPKCLLIQGNIPQEAKETGVRPLDIFAAQWALTLEGLDAHPDTELVIWPETSLPEHNGIWLPRYEGNLKRLARERGVAIVAGALMYRFDPGRRRFRAENSAYLIAADGSRQGPYVKQRLAPGSEEVPLEGVFPWFPGLVMTWFGYIPDTRAGSEALVFRISDQWSVVGDQWSVVGDQWSVVSDQSDFQPPASSPKPQAPSLQPPPSSPATLGVLICYDSAFGRLSRAQVENGAEFFACISNDGWFHGSGELDQIHAMTIMRAIETRRGFARATNTGISAFLDPDGGARIMRAVVKPESERHFVLKAENGYPGDERRFAPVGTASERQVEGFFAGSVRSTGETTVYVRLGWLFPYLAAAITLVLLFKPRPQKHGAESAA